MGFFSSSPSLLTTSSSVVIGAALLATPAFGWGVDGHKAIANIAQARLNPGALAMAEEILGGAEFSDIANWADEVRPTFTWSFNDHFINTPGVCNFDYARDCFNDNCVAGSIYNYTMQLTGEKPGYNETEALKWLVHYVGDIHQPLHSSFGADQGGNLINITYYGAPNELHAVWDYMLIDTLDQDYLKGDWTALSANLTGMLAENAWGEGAELGWSACPEGHELACPVGWANEGVAAACEFAYVKNGTALDEAYFLSRLPEVQLRLAQAAVRLAAVLNRLWA